MKYLVLSSKMIFTLAQTLPYLYVLKTNAQSTITMNKSIPSCSGNKPCIAEIKVEHVKK